MSPMRTQVMGVVNVTDDSFSDGGRHLAVDQALAHAERLLQAGGALPRRLPLLALEGDVQFAGGERLERGLEGVVLGGELC